MKTKKCTLALLILFLINSCISEERKTNSAEKSIVNELKVVPLKQRIECYTNNVMMVSKSGEFDTPAGHPDTETPIKIVIVRWQEWGRKSKNCMGWGLCYAEWFIIERYNPYVDVPVSIEEPIEEPADDDFNGNGSIIETDEETGIKYFDILLAESPDEQFDQVDLQFYIEEEIYLTDSLYVVPDIYQLQEEIGEFGGYRILLEEQ